MRRNLLWCLALLVLLALLALIGHRRQPVACPCLGTYRGSFQWEGGSEPYEALFTFEQHQGSQLAGHATYSDRSSVRIDGFLNVHNGRVQLHESAPSGPRSAFFVLDGDYYGTFSPDWTRLDAEWRSPKRRGALHLTRI